MTLVHATIIRQQHRQLLGETSVGRQHKKLEKYNGKANILYE